MARVGILLASGAALAGVAWWARSVGPWTGRPDTTSVRALPTFDVPTFNPPAPKPVDPPAAAPAVGSFDPTVVLLIVGGIFLLALVLLAASVIHNRVPTISGSKQAARPDDEVQSAPVVADPDRSFDPRQAADYVIACWDQVEQRALGRGVGRRPEQTPTEFIEALKSTYPVDDRAAAELLALYQRARFDHVALRPDTALRAAAAAADLLAALGMVRQGHP